MSPTQRDPWAPIPSALYKATTHYVAQYTPLFPALSLARSLCSQRCKKPHTFFHKEKQNKVLEKKPRLMKLLERSYSTEEGKGGREGKKHGEMTRFISISGCHFH